MSVSFSLNLTNSVAESFKNGFSFSILEQDSYTAEELSDDAYLAVACPDMWSQGADDPLYYTCNTNTSSCGSSNC
jgi:hypothetical protein